MSIGKLWSSLQQILGQWIQVLEIHLRFHDLHQGFQWVWHSLFLFISASFLFQPTVFLWEKYNWTYVSLLTKSLEFHEYLEWLPIYHEHVNFVPIVCLWDFQIIIIFSESVVIESFFIFLLCSAQRNQGELWDQFYLMRISETSKMTMVQGYLIEIQFVLLRQSLHNGSSRLAPWIKRNLG